VKTRQKEEFFTSGHPDGGVRLSSTLDAMHLRSASRGKTYKNVLLVWLVIQMY